MEYNSKFKRRLLSGTFLVLSVALVTGCGFDTGHVFGDMMGETRTVPDNDTVNFGNRHTPVLNPGTNAPMSDAGAPAPAAVANNTVVAYAPPPSVPYDTAAGSGRRVPVENENVLAGNAAPATMSAPVAPVVAAANAPVTAPAAEVVPAPVASTAAAPASDYPSLASVPPAPIAPPREQATAQMNSMVADQGQSEAARQQLINNSGATVMTSPQTGQLVDNAANAVAPVQPAPMDMGAAPVAAPQPVQANAAPAPAPKTGFNSWLHNLFGGDENASAASADNMASAPSAAPSEVAPNVMVGTAPAFPPTPTQEAVAPSPGAAMPVAIGTPLPQPTDATSASSVAGAPHVEMDVSAPPAALPVTAAPPDQGVVVLTPPPASASAGTSALPDVSQISGVNDQQPPVSLVPPSQASSSSQHLLPEARYATRRGADGYDSGSN